MSTVKNPSEKKRLSLQRDCRNIYGENPAASRKGIAKGKQRQHQNERRSAAQALAKVHSTSDDDFAADAELKAKMAIGLSRMRGFKKKPDMPLGEFLKRRKRKKDTAQAHKAALIEYARKLKE
jgi:hypothetical protein